MILHLQCAIQIDFASFRVRGSMAGENRRVSTLALQEQDDETGTWTCPKPIRKSATAEAPWTSMYSASLTANNPTAVPAAASNSRAKSARDGPAVWLGMLHWA